MTIAVREHGDRERMSPSEYASYHPRSDYAAQAGEQTDLPWRPPPDRWATTGLFREEEPFEGLPEPNRTDALIGAEQLHALGFTVPVDETGIVPADLTSRLGQHDVVWSGPPLPDRSNRLHSIVSLSRYPFAFHAEAAVRYTTSRDFADTFRHEYAHFLREQLNTEEHLALLALLGEWFYSEGRDRAMALTSTYAVDAPDVEEMWGEVFATITKPGYKKGAISIDEQVFDLLREVGVMNAIREHGDPDTDADYYTRFHPKKGSNPGLTMAATGLFMDHDPFAGLGEAKRKAVAKEAQRLHEMGWVTPIERTTVSESGKGWTEADKGFWTNGRVYEGYGPVTMDLTNRMKLNGYAASSDPGDVFRHEYAHVLVKSLRDGYVPYPNHPSHRLSDLFRDWLRANENRPVGARLGSYVAGEPIIKTISRYGWDKWDSEENWEEAFADSFSIITAPDYVAGSLPFEDDFRTVLEEIKGHPVRLSADEAMQKYDPEAWARHGSFKEHGDPARDEDYYTKYHPKARGVTWLNEGGSEFERRRVTEEANRLRDMGYSVPVGVVTRQWDYDADELDFPDLGLFHTRVDQTWGDWRRGVIELAVDVPIEEMASSVTGVDDIGSVFRHEYAHAMLDALDWEDREPIYAAARGWLTGRTPEWVIENVSFYAGGSLRGRSPADPELAEFIAESFMVITHPDYKGHLPYDKELLALLAPVRRTAVREHGDTDDPNYGRDFHPGWGKRGPVGFLSEEERAAVAEQRRRLVGMDLDMPVELGDATEYTNDKALLGRYFTGRDGFWGDDAQLYDEEPDAGAWTPGLIVLQGSISHKTSWGYGDDIGDTYRHEYAHALLDRLEGNARLEFIDSVASLDTEWVLKNVSAYAAQMSHEEERFAEIFAFVTDENYRQTKDMPARFANIVPDLRKALGAVREHGDPSMPNYAAEYHPGTFHRPPRGLTNTELMQHIDTLPPDTLIRFYHGTTPEGAKSIIEQRLLRPDDLNSVGLTSDWYTARQYGGYKVGAGKGVALEVLVRRGELGSADPGQGKRWLSEEGGGSGHDSLLIYQYRDGGKVWEGLPLERVRIVHRPERFREHGDPDSMDEREYRIRYHPGPQTKPIRQGTLRGAERSAKADPWFARGLQQPTEGYGFPRGYEERIAALEEWDARLVKNKEKWRVQNWELSAHRGEDMDTVLNQAKRAWMTNAFSPSAVLLTQGVVEALGATGSIWANGAEMMEMGPHTVDVVKALYEQTQEKLRGRDTLTVYRGLGFEPTAHNVLESWTVSLDVAREFAGLLPEQRGYRPRPGVVLQAEVPVSAVFLDLSGSFQDEVVLIGDRIPKHSVHREHGDKDRADYWKYHPEKIDTSYRSEHTAPGPHYGAPLHELTTGDLIPPDIYDRTMQMHLYGGQSTQATRGAFDVINSVRGQPDAKVTIYRGVSKARTQINPGDWVTLSPWTARYYTLPELTSDGEQGRVLSMTVPASEVWWNGDSIEEWGWWPEGFLREHGSKDDPNYWRYHPDSVPTQDRIIAEEQRIGALLDAAGGSAQEYTQTARPDLYEKHPKSGYMVRKKDVPAPQIVVKPIYQGGDGIPKLVETLPTPFGGDKVVEGSERDPMYVWRSITEESYQRWQSTGEYGSQGRMNLVSTEGTVGAWEAGATLFYLPGRNNNSLPAGDYPARIVRIDYNPADGWKVPDADYYVKTNKPIPFGRISWVSPVIVTRKLPDERNSTFSFIQDEPLKEHGDPDRDPDYYTNFHPRKGDRPPPVLAAGVLPVGFGADTSYQIYMQDVWGYLEDQEAETGGLSPNLQGQTIRGREVISPDDPRIPDEVYHVTTNLPAVLASGYLRPGGAGGLGGDNADRMVSITISEEIAKGIASATRLNAEAYRQPIAKLPYWLRDVAEAEGWVDDGYIFHPPYFEDDEPAAFLKYNHGDWLRMFFSARSSATNGRLLNPLFFGDWGRNVDPAKVGIVRIPKASLNNGALLVDFDLGTGFLEEIRSYGPVEIVGELREHGDPDVNPDYYTKFHPPGEPTEAVDEFEQKWAKINPKSEAFLIADEHGRTLQSGLGTRTRATSQHIDTSLLKPGVTLTHFHPEPNYSPETHLSYDDINNALKRGYTIRAFQKGGSWQQFVPNPRVGNYGTYLDITERDMTKRARAWAEERSADDERVRPYADPTDERDRLLEMYASRKGTFTSGTLFAEHGDPSDPNYRRDFHPGHGLIVEGENSFWNLLDTERAEVLAEAKRLRAMGFTEEVAHTGTQLGPDENGYYKPAYREMGLRSGGFHGDHFSASRTLVDDFRHEYGHVLWYGLGWAQGKVDPMAAMSDEQMAALRAGAETAIGLQKAITNTIKTWGESVGRNGRISAISRYFNLGYEGDVEQGDEEAWAEVFSLITRPDYVAGTLPFDQAIWDLIDESGVRLREHGDPDKDADYYTKFHPRQKGSITGFTGLKGAQITREQLRKGETSEGGEALIHGINDAPASAPVLYRGVGMKRGQAARTYRDGEKVWLNLSSWTTNEGLAEHFAKNAVASKWNSAVEQVVFVLDEGAKAVAAGGESFFDEGEWITAGLFEVTSNFKGYDNGYGVSPRSIYLTQVDTFKDAAQVAATKMADYGSTGRAPAKPKRRPYDERWPEFAEHGDPDVTPPDEYQRMHPGSKRIRHTGTGQHDPYTEYEMEREAGKQATADGINARVAEFKAQGGAIEVEPEHGVGSDGMMDMMAVDMGSHWEQSRGTQFTRQAIERGRKTRREKPDLVQGVITAWTIDADSGYSQNVAGAVNYFVMDEFRIPFGKTYKRKYMYLDYVGSTGILKGVGSALTREVLLIAAQRKLPLLLTADPPALSYWQDVWGMQRNPFNFDLGNTWSRMSGSDALYGLTADQVKDLARRLKADGTLINAHFGEIAAELEYDPDAAPFRDLWLSFREHGDPSDPDYAAKYHPGPGGGSIITDGISTGLPREMVSEIRHEAERLYAMGVRVEVSRVSRLTDWQAKLGGKSMDDVQAGTDGEACRIYMNPVFLPSDGYNMAVTAGDTFRHETAHIIWAYMDNAQQQTAISMLYRWSRGNPTRVTEGLSRYATDAMFTLMSGPPFEEAFAEAFAVLTHPDYKKGTLKFDAKFWALLNTAGFREHGDKSDPDYYTKFHPGPQGIPIDADREAAIRAWTGYRDPRYEDYGFFVTDSSGAIRSALRGESIDKRDEAERLLQLTAEAPHVDFWLHRGLSVSDESLARLEALKKGAVEPMNLSGWSSEIGAAIQYMGAFTGERKTGDNQVLFSLLPGAHGLSTEGLTPLAWEAEYLTQGLFEVVSVHREPDPRPWAKPPLRVILRQVKPFESVEELQAAEIKEHGDPDTTPPEEYARMHPNGKRLIAPEIGPMTGFPEPYDPNEPSPSGEPVSKSDYLYWTAATNERMESIKTHGMDHGAIGQRLTRAAYYSPPTTEMLYRGARSTKPWDFYVGQRLHWGLTSFSANFDVAWPYAGRMGTLRKVPLYGAIIRLEPGAHAFHISALGGPYADDEWVTAFGFEVTKVGREELPDGSSVPAITIRQTGNFREHGSKDDPEYEAKFHPGTHEVPFRALPPGDNRFTPATHKPMSEQPPAFFDDKRPQHRIIDRAQGNPKMMVKVYRGEEGDVTEIRPGDWVSLDDAYASYYAPGGNVLTMRLPAGELYGERYSPMEWVWWPPGYFREHGTKGEPGYEKYHPGSSEPGYPPDPMPEKGGLGSAWKRSNLVTPGPPVPPEEIDTNRQRGIKVYQSIVSHWGLPETGPPGEGIYSSHLAGRLNLNDIGVVMYDMDSLPVAVVSISTEGGPYRGPLVSGVSVRADARGKGWGFRLYDFVQDHTPTNMYEVIGVSDSFTHAGKQFALAWLKHRAEVEGVELRESGEGLQACYDRVKDAPTFDDGTEIDPETEGDLREHGDPDRDPDYYTAMHPRGRGLDYYPPDHPYDEATGRLLAEEVPFKGMRQVMREQVYREATRLQQMGFTYEVNTSAGDLPGALGQYTQVTNLLELDKDHFQATSYSAGSNIGDTFRHEYGHAVWSKLDPMVRHDIGKQYDVWSQSIGELEVKRILSKYATEMMGGWQEQMAESFLRITAEGYKWGTLPYDTALFDAFRDAGVLVDQVQEHGDPQRDEDYEARYHPGPSRDPDEVVTTWSTGGGDRPLRRGGEQRLADMRRWIEQGKSAPLWEFYGVEGNIDSALGAMRTDWTNSPGGTTAKLMQSSVIAAGLSTGRIYGDVDGVGLLEPSSVSIDLVRRLYEQTQTRLADGPASFRLYRGISYADRMGRGVLESWTFNKSVAQRFAQNTGARVYAADIPREAIFMDYRWGGEEEMVVLGGKRSAARIVMREHGDKDSMSPAMYAAFYHPGTAYGRAGVSTSALRASGLFDESEPFSALHAGLRADISKGSSRLAEMGFTAKVHETGVLNKDTPGMPPEIAMLPASAMPQAGTIGYPGMDIMYFNPANATMTGYSGAQNAGDIFRHEYGHVVWKHLSDGDRLQLGLRMSNWVAKVGIGYLLKNVSSYAVSSSLGNEPPEELWAEVFRVMTHPDYVPGTFPFDQASWDALRKAGVMTDPLREHGDKNDPDYERLYHPGQNAAQDALGSTGLFKEVMPFRNLPVSVRQSILEGALRLHDMGFTSKVPNTGVQTQPGEAGFYTPDIEGGAMGIAPDGDYTTADYTASRSPADTFRHEYGHHLWFSLNPMWTVPMQDLIKKVKNDAVRKETVYNDLLRNISPYFIKGSVEESWAEVFSVITNPAYVRGTIKWDGEVFKFMQGMGWLPRLMAEHGDKSAMSDAEYEALYHPGPVGVERAIRMLRRGDRPSIHPQTVSPLLRATSKETGKLNLSSARVEGAFVWGGGMGIPRDDMPSLPMDQRDAFFGDLRKEASLTSEAIHPRALMPMQGQLDAIKVGQMYVAMLEGMTPPGDVLISRDGFVLDGHHRWGSGVALSFDRPDMTISVTRIDMDAADLLAWARRWTREHGVEARKFAEHGDPDKDADYYTKFHPKGGPKELASYDLFEQKRPFSRGLTQAVRGQIALGAQRLHEMGFRHRVYGARAASLPPDRLAHYVPWTREIEIDLAKPPDPAYTALRDYADVFRHEYGHAVLHAGGGGEPHSFLRRTSFVIKLTTVLDEFRATHGDEQIKALISAYAAYGDKRKGDLPALNRHDELWAEAFAVMTRADYKMGALPFDTQVFDLMREHGVMASLREAHEW